MEATRYLRFGNTPLLQFRFEVLHSLEEQCLKDPSNDLLAGSLVFVDTICQKQRLQNRFHVTNSLSVVA